MARCVCAVLEQDVCTALYGLGAGLSFSDEWGNCKPGYRCEPTFDDINDCRNYVPDEAAKLV